MIINLFLLFLTSRYCKIIQHDIILISSRKIKLTFICPLHMYLLRKYLHKYSHLMIKSIISIFTLFVYSLFSILRNPFQRLNARGVNWSAGLWPFLCLSTHNCFTATIKKQSSTTSMIKIIFKSNDFQLFLFIFFFEKNIN